jgi:hypothetical protein
VYHRGKILNTSTNVGFDIHVTCIFSGNDTINL